MILRHFINLLLCSVISIQVGFAQYPIDVQYSTITANTPALPDIYNTVVDATVPTDINIKRISEYVDSTGWYPKFEYAKIQPWNADGSIYKFYSAAIFDADTHQKIRDLEAGQIYPSMWSNTNPDLIYGFRDNGEIRTYSIQEDAIHTVFTIPGYEYVKLGPGEGNMDENDKYVALVGKHNTDLDVIIFDLQANTIVHTETFSGAWDDGTSWSPKYIDWVSVSQSGKYIGIMWNHNTTSSSNPYNGHFGVEIYNTTDMQFLRRIADYGNHGDFGYAANGEEVFVQFWGPTGTVNMFYLDRLERVVISTNADFGVSGHISCRNLNRPGWAYISQSDAAQSGQIIAMKLDESGIVEHFGHHFSSTNVSPMPVPNPSGDRVMLKSNFGDNAPDLVYIFEATAANPLALEWSAPLTAFQQKNKVLLTWSIAQQVNNEILIIEHSTNGIHFEPIGSFNGDGNLEIEKQLLFSHNTPTDGENYYRIKQVDFDQKFDYSNVAFVRFTNKTSIRLSPNPAYDEMIITTDFKFDHIQIFNHTGKQIKHSSNRKSINISDLPKGTYTIQLTGSNQSVVQQFLKM